MNELESIRAMTDRELDVAIACELMDLTLCVDPAVRTNGCWMMKNGAGAPVLLSGKRTHEWQPSSDLNAVAEAEAMFADTNNHRTEYNVAISEVVDVSRPKIERTRFFTTTAPARQRAEACLLAWRRIRREAP